MILLVRRYPRPKRRLLPQQNHFPSLQKAQVVEIAGGAIYLQQLLLTNRQQGYDKILYCRLTEFGPPMWQAEAVIVSFLSALPATAVGQILLTLAKFC